MMIHTGARERERKKKSGVKNFDVSPPLRKSSSSIRTLLLLSSGLEMNLVVKHGNKSIALEEVPEDATAAVSF